MEEKVKFSDFLSYTPNFKIGNIFARAKRNLPRLCKERGFLYWSENSTLAASTTEKTTIVLFIASYSLDDMKLLDHIAASDIPPEQICVNDFAAKTDVYDIAERLILNGPTPHTPCMIRLKDGKFAKFTGTKAIFEEIFPSGLPMWNQGEKPKISER